MNPLQHRDIATEAPTTIPEVAAFVRAERALAAWIRQHPEAAHALAELAPLYNATLESAKAAIAKRQVQAGPFVLHQWRRSDNAEALYEAVGRQAFPASGGELNTVETKTIDRARFDSLVLAGKLKPELVAKVVTWAPTFKSLKPISLPLT